MAAITTHALAGELSQSKMRRLKFIRALQSDRSTVIVGPCKEVFEVSKDLLTQCSPTFEKLCRLGTKEREQQIVNLPEDDPLIFEDFLIWLHSLTPSLPLDGDSESLVKLGVFAEKYRIRYLINQISDVIRTAASKGNWKPSPEILRTAYSGTLTSSIIRRLCSLVLTVSLSKESVRTDLWKPVFTDFADLGWDYFRRVQMGQTSTRDIMSKGACRFHDHLDVFGWVRHEVRTCPFPEGAPITVLKDERALTTGFDSGMEKLRKLDEEYEYTTDKHKHTIRLDPEEINQSMGTLNPEPSKTTDEILHGAKDDSGLERPSQRESRKKEKGKREMKRTKSKKRSGKPISHKKPTESIDEPAEAREELANIVKEPAEAVEEPAKVVGGSIEAFEDFTEVVEEFAEANEECAEACEEVAEAVDDFAEVVEDADPVLVNARCFA
ncbi:MAG: hypothetical protein LQ349_000614 [Xanthoria aureola]|nr:MAG: hypothetical protein LQ349_000614 [Xanthoria aureola]